MSDSQLPGDMYINLFMLAIAIAGGLYVSSALFGGKSKYRRPAGQLPRKH